MYMWHIGIESYSATFALAFQLLQKDPKSRCGCLPAGAKDVKNQALFKHLNWKRLAAGITEPPFVPDVCNNSQTA